MLRFQKTVISPSSSFASVGWVRDVVVLEVDRQRIMSLNVGLAQVRKPTEWKSVSLSKVYKSFVILVTQ